MHQNYLTSNNSLDWRAEIVFIVSSDKARLKPNTLMDTGLRNDKQKEGDFPYLMKWSDWCDEM